MKPLSAHNFLQSRINRLLRKPTDDYGRTIGTILRKRGVITEEQLQNALKVQKDKLYTFGKAVRLGQIIVELGYALEEELVEATGLPPIFRLEHTQACRRSRHFRLHVLSQ